MFVLIFVTKNVVVCSILNLHTEEAYTKCVLCAQYGQRFQINRTDPLAVCAFWFDVCSHLKRSLFMCVRDEQNRGAALKAIQTIVRIVSLFQIHVSFKTIVH